MAVRGTLSPTGPWRPAGAARLTRTLGLAAKQCGQSSTRLAPGRSPRQRHRIGGARGQRHAASMVKPEFRCPWQSKQITEGESCGEQTLVARSACALRVRQWSKWLQSQVAQGARCTARRCLTPRCSRRAPALVLGRALWWFILHHAAQAQRRRARLNSHVRPQETPCCTRTSKS